MIGYESDIGFAIGRLVQVFYESALRWSGDQRQVHFSFAKLREGNCANLPQGFTNLLEFDYRRNDPAQEDRLVAYVREHQIEVVLALDMAVQCPCLKAARRAGVRTVLSYWGAPMSSILPPIVLALKRLEVRYLRRSRPDHFIFESEAMRRFAVYGRGLHEKCTTVIPTGVDAEKFKPMPQSASSVYERFGIPVSRKIVVYMGHLHRRKGVHVLMRAAEHWVRNMSRNDVHCLFLGNRDTEPEHYRSEYDSASQFITFGGYQSDIPELLAGCTLGCVPSTGWDSFPMSSLEMQSCGLPVIVSNLQGVPETVVNHMTGIVVPAGDHVLLAQSVIALIDDDERRAQLAARARRRVLDGYTREHQIKSLTLYLGSVAG